MTAEPGELGPWAVDVEQLKRVINARRAVDETGIHTRVGAVLMSIQNVEKSLRFLLTFVIQKGVTLNLASLEAQTEAERKKTIGWFLSQLRGRVDIHPAVNERFSAFLTLRNQFAHDLSSVPGWSTESAEGLKSANDFLTEVHAHTIWIYFWLSGITRSWAVQNDMETDIDDDPVIHFIDQTFRPIAEQTVQKLTTNPMPAINQTRAVPVRSQQKSGPKSR